MSGMRGEEKKMRETSKVSTDEDEEERMREN